ncbi:anti-sigma factor antagonist BldG [Microbacterium sediminicola]|uniref:Anti-sigma factor antagonist n=1 Tax=Microbacterium sediminicola TaxID=415210 RepID=A0ABP4TXU3_9MICO
MNLDTHRDGDYAVIVPTGRITASTAPSLRSTIDALVADGTPRIVLDMAGVEFIDSTGLGVLIGGLKSTRTAGGDLRIAAVPDVVRRVLTLTNLDRVLRAYETTSAAVSDA